MFLRSWEQGRGGPWCGFSESEAMSDAVGPDPAVQAPLGSPGRTLKCSHVANGGVGLVWSHRKKDTTLGAVWAVCHCDFVRPRPVIGAFSFPQDRDSGSRKCSEINVTGNTRPRAMDKCVRNPQEGSDCFPVALIVEVVHMALGLTCLEKGLRERVGPRDAGSVSWACGPEAARGHQGHQGGDLRQDMAKGKRPLPVVRVKPWSRSPRVAEASRTRELTSIRAAGGARSQ